MSTASPQAQMAINTLRALAIDQVERANSGHPGAPLGCAPIAYLLFHKVMKFNPANPLWSDRDRFVLSNGHASALLYGVLHLTGFDLPLEQLQQFRQWGSHTPGHPEYGETPGVEVTTGPLGQGFAEAVGLAIAERHLAAVYDQGGMNPVDHHTYVLFGDGDLMEGVSHEAASLAATLGLGKLVVFYDDNLVSLDGPTELSFTEDVTARFDAYGWQVQFVPDGNDLAALEIAVEAAKADRLRPSLIRVRTIIGFGSPKAGSNRVHGEALGPDATKATKRALGVPEDRSFYIPIDTLQHWREAVKKGQAAQHAWDEQYERYRNRFPELSERYDRTTAMKLAPGWVTSLPVFPLGEALATRTAGNVVMNAIAGAVPELFGGAADLTSSTKTIFKDSGNFHRDPRGRNVFFGVREFAMMAAVNGMAAHGGLIPFGSTFFNFSDYCRPALRMGALQSSHSLYIFTHDSVGLGEDGPTHQPVEQLSALRAIPQLTDFRPADANETAACWRLALERGSASFMALSRQELPVLDAHRHDIYAGVSRGAYILEEGDALILVGTGSEVSVILAAAAELAKMGVRARVISMPSFALFEEQSVEYKSSLFPKGVPTLSVEAGATMCWWRYVGREGRAIGIDRFGASAPGPIALNKLGISIGRVVDEAVSLLLERQSGSSRRAAVSERQSPGSSTA